MIYAALKLLHWASIIIWMGGMFFALFCLRPAGTMLEPALRVPFMARVLGRFFDIVLWAALAAVVSGGAMVMSVARATRKTGAAFNVPADWLMMGGVGLLMLVVYGYIRWSLYRRVTVAVSANDWPAGAAALNEIRFWVGANLAFGTVILTTVVLGQAS